MYLLHLGENEIMSTADEKALFFFFFLQFQKNIMQGCLETFKLNRIVYNKVPALIDYYLNIIIQAMLSLLFIY